LKHVTQETLTRQLLEFVGLTLVGPAISSEIRTSLSDHTIDITLTVLCARNLDTDRIMGELPSRLLHSRISQSESFSNSSPSTSKPFPPMSDGNNGWLPKYLIGEIWSLLQAARDGSWDVEMIRQRSGKLLHTIHKEASQT